jgi:signal peptidase I
MQFRNVPCSARVTSDTRLRWTGAATHEDSRERVSEGDRERGSSEAPLQDEGGAAPGAEAPAGPRSKGLGDWTRSIVIAFVLFLVVRTFVVEAFKIPTSSMENTLLVGDFLLVNKAVYGSQIPGTDLRIGAFKEPDRGDVVVFHPPHEPEKNYVKRVVGVPHDTLEMRGKQLYRNGAPVDEPYARHVDGRGDAVHPDMRWQSGYLIAATPPKYHPTRDNWGPLVVPPGQLLRARRQPRQQRGLELLGLRIAGGDSRRAVDRVLLVRSFREYAASLDAARALGSPGRPSSGDATPCRRRPGGGCGGGGVARRAPPRF